MRQIVATMVVALTMGCANYLDGYRLGPGTTEDEFRSAQARCRLYVRPAKEFERDAIYRECMRAEGHFPVPEQRDGYAVFKKGEHTR